MTSQVNLIKNRVNPFYITDEDVLEGEVETYADLPATANLNDVYVVRTTTGIIGNRELAGLYVYAVSGWVAMPIAMISSNVFYDNTTSGLSANTVKNALDELNSGEKHVTSASFNTGDGVLTLTLNDSSTVTVNLDGRFLQNIIEDTTPQLGGNLDLNSNNITGTGDIDITGEITATTLIGNMRGATIFKAKAGEALTKGDPVYISGDDLTGNQPVVSIADSDDANKMPCFGLALETVSANANVNVVTFGTLSGLDTSSFNQGDILYISTTGTLTATKPSGESSLIQNIGKVMRSHASVGSIKVGGAGRTNDVPNLNNGNVFIGNASNQSETRSLTLDDVAETVDKKIFTATEQTKLSGIEDNATADQTDSEIKTAYESNTDTNAFTDTEKTKLAGIATNAEVNIQSNWAETDTNSDAFILNKPTVDSTLSTTSTNPVENQAITNEINTKQDTLTFGIASTNSLRVDGSASTNQYAQFTTNGLVGSSNISANNIIASGLMYRNGALQTASRQMGSSQGDSTSITSLSVDFSSQDVQDSDFFSYVTPTGASNSTGLQLKVAGYYQISYNLSVANTTYINRITWYSKIIRNGTQEPAFDAYTYTRNITVGHRSHLDNSYIKYFDANQWLQVIVLIAKNTGNFNQDFSGAQVINGNITGVYLGT